MEYYSVQISTSKQSQLYQPSLQLYVRKGGTVAKKILEADAQSRHRNTPHDT